MASSKSYLEFILEQLTQVEGITFCAMMGEYIIYCRGKIIGGIYDNKFLVKPIQAAKDYLVNATYELPYVGGNPMLLVDNVDDKEFLSGLIETMLPLLPTPKKKNK